MYGGMEVWRCGGMEVWLVLEMFLREWFKQEEMPSAGRNVVVGVVSFVCLFVVGSVVLLVSGDGGQVTVEAVII